MSLPQLLEDVEPSERLRSLRQKRHRRLQRSARTTRFRALGWELTGRLTVNLALTLVGLSSLVRLIPYYQTQRQVLQDMEASVATIEQHTQTLRADFSRYFDPTQAGQVIQENGVRESAQHIPIVWVNPAATPSHPSPAE
jgi:hypothetical protein